ncbi:Alpha-D-phosphohexomutase [Gracilaria domingensis]|nr:Alpha-D-phosphohexomutase [Gracilaria domingensis]
MSAPTPPSPAPAPPSSPSAALLHLQNGSDVRGVAAALHPEQPVTLTEAAVSEIVAAFVRAVADKLRVRPADVRVALGRDSRITGERLLRAAASGAASERAAVFDFGLCTTPAMFMSTVLEGYQYECACMLTASHLPPNRNGIKFFTREGSADKNAVRAMLVSASHASTARARHIDTIPNAVKQSFLPVYAHHLADLIRTRCNHPTHYHTPLEGFKIVVDAGNGAAGFFAQILTSLGADTIGQFLEPDGMFPNHVPNPEDKKAMQMTVDATKRENAHLGVIFDTDVDRSGFVASNGVAINRNKLIALLARIVLREHPASTIVTDSVTSNGLKRFIESLGGKHFRYRKGYKNVIDKGIELNRNGVQTELAIETSGHGAMRENYMLDDGAYLAVKIIVEMVRMRLSGDERGIGGLLDGLDEPLEEKEFRLPFLDQGEYQAYGANVVEAFADFAQNVDGWTLEDTNYEGYRVSVDEGDGKAGWLLLRQSLHDPLLPLNVESETSGGVAAIVNVLVNDFFPNYTNVDTSPLKAYVQ